MQNVRFYGLRPYRAAVVHGGPGAPGSVAAIARELSRDLGVIEPLQTGNSIAGLLEETDQAVAAACDGPITLIGHSWGAWLVFIYAAKYPHRVGKLILVGSGPFEARYVPEIVQNRKKHLSENEQREFDELISRLDSAGEGEKDRLLERLGGLVGTCDNYSTFAIDTDKEDCLPADGENYSAVWGEASALRESGGLLELADDIGCPVTVIHGAYDPHPANGVRLPLESAIRNITFYILDKCGHSPWKEKYAYQEFYAILRKELEEVNL